MESQFKNLGLASKLHRIDATDALTMRDQPCYRPHRWGARWELTPSEVACFISHRRCWEAMLAEGLDHVVIMEDDVIVSDQMEAAVADIVRLGPTDFDVVKLDGVPQLCRYGTTQPLRDERRFRDVLQVAASAGCYLLSRQGAERLLAGSNSFCDHLDDYVFNPASGQTIYQLEPAVSVQAIWSSQAEGQAIDGKVAGSERTENPHINSLPSRGPVLYRLAKEVRRSARKLYRRLYGDRMLTASGGLIGAPQLAPDLGDYKRK